MIVTDMNTDDAIIESAVIRALENGWETHKAEKRGSGWSWHFGIIKHPDRFVFDKDFAVAFWGEDYLEHLTELSRQDSVADYLRKYL